MADQQPSYARSVLSGPDGAGSTARVCSVLIVAAAIAWVTYLVLRNDRLPDLTNLTLWVTSTVSALYGVNKVSNMIGRRGGQ